MKIELKKKILKHAGITSDFDQYEIEETIDSYVVYKTVGDTTGCILPGIIHTDMDKDGITDVKHSTVAMEALQYYIGDTKELTIQIRS